MVCESWKEKLDTYLDGELPAEEMRAFDAHVRGCPSCAADALARVQMKRAIQSLESALRRAPSFARGCSRALHRGAVSVPVPS